MDALHSWEQERAALMTQIGALRQQGICYNCHDLATGEVFRGQVVVDEDADFKIVLDSYPRMVGHTIVVYKPHREDISELADDETARLFQRCVEVVQAIKAGLGAEKVYVVTMCDGGINHLHIQLLPRYAGEPIGSKRLVDARGPLVDGEKTAQAIRKFLK